MNYSASMDSYTKWSTIIVLAILSAVILFIFFQKSVDYYLKIFSILLLIALVVFSFLYKSLGFTINETSIIIHRYIGNTTISRDSIQSMTKLNSDELKGAIRTFGIGGLFGWYGKYYNSSKGSMTWYITRRDSCILLTTMTNQKIVISPNCPEDFLKH